MNFENITEHEPVVEALRDSEERYRSLVESTRDAIFTLSPAGMITSLNPAFEKITGWSCAEWIGKPFVSLLHPDDVQTAMNLFQQALQKEILPMFELRVLLRSGGYALGEFTTISQVQKGIFKGVLGIARDITEHKRAEEDLRRSEKKFQKLFHEAPVGYMELDMEGCVKEVNRTELRMLGYTAEEMSGQPIWKFVVEEEKARQMVKTKLSGSAEPGKAFEQTYKRKDGTALPVLIEEAFIHDEEGRITGIHSTLQDITERKKVEEAMVALQEQFRQSQKMEAVGRLAGGIAHDFNNLLTVIRGYTQLSLLELKEGDPLRRNIEEIQKATERGADLTSQLLAFSRRRVMETKTLDVNALLKEMDKMLRRVIGEDINLNYRLADDLGKVKAHPGQIGQMIINIAVNARDAMPKGGKLTIETADVKFDEISNHTYGDRITGPYVMLSVNDTGCGMTSEIKDHIFEPFFTTKEKGKGTGLGLSTVYGIVKHSGGIIQVYSKPGEGTTFKIYLPRADELSDEVGKKITGIEIPRGNETILLVEDEEEVLKLTQQILRMQGYQVFKASCGEDAARMAQEHAQEGIHLLLTDIIMPGMNGYELAQELRSQYPEMKILYMSGYADHTLIHQGMLEEGAGYIQKPFTLESLARKVREVLKEAN